MNHCSNFPLGGDTNSVRIYSEEVASTIENICKELQVSQPTVEEYTPDFFETCMFRSK